MLELDGLEMEVPVAYGKYTFVIEDGELFVRSKGFGPLKSYTGDFAVLALVEELYEARSVIDEYNHDITKLFEDEVISRASDITNLALSNLDDLIRGLVKQNEDLKKANDLLDSEVRSLNFRINQNIR